MEIAFETRELRDMCENSLAAIRAFGDDVAQKLRARLADLDSAENLSELVTGNLRLMGESDSPSFALDLASNVQLKFCANHRSQSRLADGSMDLSRISRIRILGIDVNAEN